jgi:putative peptidoglycan lipid II flippase
MCIGDALMTEASMIDPVCPRCQDALPDGDARATCPQCGAAYHPACWDGTCVACAPPTPVKKPQGTSSVVKGASIIFVGMLLSRVLGLVRENLLFNTFGDSNVAGAYNLAFVFPDLFYNLLAGGALSAAFIPVFTAYLSKGEDDRAHEVGSTITTLLFVAMLVCVGIVILFAPQVIGGLQYLQPSDTKLDQASLNLTVSLTRVMCFMLIFTALSGLFTGILQSFKHFVTPVLVWLAYNVAIILGIALFSKLPVFGGSPQNPSIYGVAFSVVFGAVLMAVIQFPVALRLGFKFRWGLNLRHEGVQRVLALFAPVMVSLALSQVNLMLLPLILGSRFGFPAVTDIRAANRLVLLPLGLFAIAIATAAFPKLSQQMALGEKREFRGTLAQGMKMILLLSVPSAMILFVLAEPITYLLWGGGKFGQNGVQASAFVLVFFAWGLLGLGLAQIVTRAFYAMHDTITPTLVGVVMVAASFALAIYCSTQPALGMDYASVAFATTVTSTLSTLLMMELLRRRMGGFGGWSLLGTSVKILIASAVMGVVMFLVAKGLAPTHQGEVFAPAFRWPAPPVPRTLDLSQIEVFHIPRMRFALQVAASLLAGGATYLGALWLLRVDELRLLLARLTGRFRKTA